MTPSVACVGAGYFSQFHYGSWSRMDGVDLKASCDLDPVSYTHLTLPTILLV